MNVISKITQDNSNQAKLMLDGAIKKALTECGEYARNVAVTVVPVDTGNLKNSIEYQVTDRTMALGSAVEYAPYVELGTSKVGKRPFLRYSIEEKMSEHMKILKEHLGGS